MEVEIATVVWGIGSVTLASIDGEIWNTHKVTCWNTVWEVWVLGVGGCGSSVSPMLF